MAHRVGLPSDMPGLNDPAYTIRDLFGVVEKSTPVAGFREKLNYSNLNYALAGVIVARVSGMSWDQFITSRILKPLGMNSTYATPSRLKELLGDPNDLDSIFIRVIEKEGKIVSDRWFGWDYLYAPAGSIISTGTDITKWMILQLQDGEFEGKRFFSKSIAREMRNPIIVEDVLWARQHDIWWEDVRNQYSPLIGYGLGWWSFDYSGRRVKDEDSSDPSPWTGAFELREGNRSEVGMSEEVLNNAAGLFQRAVDGGGGDRPLCDR